MSFSRVVRTPEQARTALADPGDALDLRAPAALDEEWAALGFTELSRGELIRPLQVVLATPADTHALGVRLAAYLRAGDLVVLSGPLGAGKTALTQGIGAGLGVQGPVTSPTFVLARVHRGPVPLVHVDAYRLLEATGVVHLDDLDLDEELPRSVTVVEWGEGVVDDLAGSRLHVALGRGIGTTQMRTDHRTACVFAHGDRWVVVHAP